MELWEPDRFRGEQIGRTYAQYRPESGFFVPNHGQWKHAAKFVHHSGGMTLFLEEPGWIVNLA